MRLQTILKAQWVRQGVKFGLVGALNTALDIGIYTLLTRLVDFFGDHTTTAKIISYSVGVINSFIWNRNWTFRSTVNPWRAFLPFIAVNVVGVGINAAVFTLAMRLAWLAAPYNEFLAIALATASALVWNFLASKKIVFRK